MALHADTSQADQVPLLPETQALSTSDTLSRKAQITGIISPIVLLAILLLVSPYTVLLLPFVFLPTCCFLYYRHTLPRDQRGSLETVFWTYFLTATISMVVLVIVQLVLCYAFATVLFGSDTEFFMKEWQTVSKERQIRDDEHRVVRARFAARPSYWVFMLLMTFVIAGLCEEIQKYLSITLAVKYHKVVHSWEYVLYGIAASLGFSTMENVMFLFPEMKESGWRIAMTVFERLVLGTPGHTLCGISTALRMIERNVQGKEMSIVQVLGRSVFFHGAFDFGMMTVSALNGHIGWVHPENPLGIGSCLVIFGSLILVLARLVLIDVRRLESK